MPETAAATIVAKIDTTTVEGWNLRALLLRLADGDAWRAPDVWRTAATFDLFVCGILTPLGREVAARLRPEPWVCVDDPARPFRARVASFDHEILCTASALAERIAALLTQDDLRAAKTYTAEPVAP
jgi:hypothetical protein